jgi:hypothetical protein
VTVGIEVYVGEGTEVEVGTGITVGVAVDVAEQADSAPAILKIIVLIMIRRVMISSLGLFVRIISLLFLLWNRCHWSRY